MINLKSILEKHPEWINDSKKLRAALNDLYPSNRREIDLLLVVFDDGLVHQIKQCTEIDNRVMDSFASTLYNNHGIQKDLAAEAIEAWADVFDVPIAVEQKVKTEKKNIDYDSLYYKDYTNSTDSKSNKKLLNIVLLLIIVTLLIFAGRKGYKYYHRNDIRPNRDSSDYVGEDYIVVINELKDAGFSNIKIVLLADLEKSEANLFGTVYQVAINGKTKFSDSSWFSKDSDVKVTYHGIDPNKKDDIQIPENYYDYKGMDYITVVKKFQTAGFENIELRPNYDVSLFSKVKQYELDKISIQGDSKFTAGTWVSPDINVVIVYHDKKANKKKEDNNIKIITDSDVIIQYASKEYKKENYKVVKKKLENEGFLDIKTKRIKDLVFGKLKKDGQTESVTINGKDEFDEGDIFPKNSKIIVSYHTYKKQK